MKVITKIKQINDSKVTYLGCIINETIQSMALKVINNNLRLKFLHRKNNFLTHVLRRLLLIQPRFDYASHVCSRPCASLAWYPNLTQKMKNKIHLMQNKRIQYGLQLEKLTHILKKEFETLTGYLQMTDSINP